jgi:hypothetical protein
MILLFIPIHPLSRTIDRDIVGGMMNKNGKKWV